LTDFNVTLLFVSLISDRVDSIWPKDRTGNFDPGFRSDRLEIGIDSMDSESDGVEFSESMK